MKLSDEELIRRVVWGDDHHAFSELVRRYQSSVRNFLRKMTSGDVALADDLSQEVFLKAFRHLNTFQFRSSFSSWLYQIAYRVFLSELRKGYRREITDEHIKERIGGVDPDSYDLRQDVREAMKVLLPSERAAIHLHYQEGCTHVEISDIMNIPLGTVKTRLLQGKEKLRKLLNEWRIDKGEFHESG